MSCTFVLLVVLIGGPMTRSSFKSLWLLPLVAMLSCVAAQAQISSADTTPEHGIGGSVPMSIYSDNIAMKLRLETERWRKDTYVVIDYAQTNAFEIQACVLGTLRFGDNENTLKVLAEDFHIEVAKEDISVAPDLLCNTLTAEYAEENNQIDVAAKIGWPILKHYSLRLNFDTQELVLTPAQERSAEDARAEFELVVNDLQKVGDQVWVPVFAGADERVYMQFDTSTYHTRIDQELASTISYPSDKGASVYFSNGESDRPISEMAALMRIDFESDDRTNAGQTLATGLSLLTGYDLEINPQRGYLALTQITNSNYRSQDEEFYAAVEAKDRHALDTFLAAHPVDRNVEEAVEYRFVYGLEASDDIEVQMAALEKGVDVTDKGERFRYLNGFVGLAAQAQADPNLQIAIGERSLEFVGVSNNPADRQQIQMYMGDLFFEQDNVREATRYYMSAGFNGDPRAENVVKFKLATVYEKQERWGRAYANYARALREQMSLPSAMVASAQEGLSRIRPNLDPDDPLIAEVENMRKYVASVVNVGDQLPDVTAKTLEGVEQTLEDFKGKVVLIDVWATWCGPCIAGLPKLREVAKKFEGTNFTVLSVSADDKAETVKEFLEEEELPWDHWHIGATSETHQKWNIRGYPTYMLISTDGTLLARGHSLTEEMIQQIEQNLIQI